MTSAIQLSPLGAGCFGEVTLKGSKSFSNRALILSAVANGDSQIINISDSEDTNDLIRCLKLLGVEIKAERSSGTDEEKVVVSSAKLATKNYKGKLDVGAAGTTARFLVALCSALDGVDVEIQGKARLHMRPFHPLFEVLRALGAQIHCLDREGYLPVRIIGKQLLGGKVELRADLSSQFITAISMVAPLMKNPLEIYFTGKRISQSYLRMTSSAMTSYRLNNKLTPDSFIISGGACAGNYFVEGDASAAPYFWGIALLSKGKIKVKNIAADSIQGDVKILEAFSRMGATIESGGTKSSWPWIAVSCTGKFQNINVDMLDLPDSILTLGVLLAFAEGRSVITGADTLQHKESDRGAVLISELSKFGKKGLIKENDIEIFGNSSISKSDSAISTYDDHRVAMSFAMLGSIMQVTINNPEVVNKSFPTFWEEAARFINVKKLP